MSDGSKYVRVYRERIKSLIVKSMGGKCQRFS